MRLAASFLAVVLIVLLVVWQREPPLPLPVAPPAPPAGSITNPAPVSATEPAQRTPAEAVPRTAPPSPAQREGELQRWLEPGELEVRVLRHGQPVAGARIRAWRTPPGHLADAGADGSTPICAGETDAAGLVTFTGLAPGEVAVRADSAAQWRVARATVGGQPAQPAGGRTVVLQFGSGSIVGRAVDAAGQPLAGWHVQLAATGPHHFACSTRTAPDGGFLFDELHAGRYHVQLEQRGAWSAERERMLTLALDEHARCDFGPVATPGLLRGRIVDGHLAVVPGERTLRLVHAEHNDERRARTAADGTFTIELPRGRWQLFADDVDDARSLATVELGAAATVDVPWPGIRLLGVVVAAPGAAPPDADDLRRSTYLRGPVGVAQAEHAFMQDGQLYLQWLELPPGDYVLQPQGEFRFADAPRAGIDLRLWAGQRVTSVTLKIEPL